MRALIPLFPPLLTAAIATIGLLIGQWLSIQIGVVESMGDLDWADMFLAAFFGSYWTEYRA